MDDDDDYRVDCCVCGETVEEKDDGNDTVYETVCDNCDSDSSKKEDD